MAWVHAVDMARSEAAALGTKLKAAEAKVGETEDKLKAAEAKMEEMQARA